MANTALALTNSWEDGEYWTEAIMDTVETELEADSLQKTNNLSQIIADAFVSGYTLDSDGVANRTNSLENKQTSTDTYNADISLETTVDTDWEDVDATNASITFTPEVAGKYRVTFQFVWEIVTAANTDVDVTVKFRLTDSTNTSTPVRILLDPENSAAAALSFGQVVSISHIFTFTAVSQTIKLQKYITDIANITTHRVAGATSDYGMYMTCEKI